MNVASYYDITDANVVSTDQKFKEEVTYADARGNIATLKRNGMYPSGAALAVGQIDNLTYTTTAGTNRLASVTDAAPTAGKAFGFKSATGSFSYDANGNLRTDPNKGITSPITYNYLNLPQTINYSGGKSLTMVYDATGAKLRTTAAGPLTADNYSHDYAGGIEYRKGVLEAVYHEEGRVTPKPGGGWQYEYAIRDHLGNTRLIFSDLNGDRKIDVTNTSSNEVLQENHYYPFGLAQNYSWMNAAGAEDVRYRYNGKEFSEELGLYDYGARWYDPAIGRWNAVDQLAEKMSSWSGYNYTFGNPISFIDVNGLYPEPILIRHTRSHRSRGTGGKWKEYTTHYTFTSSAAHLLSLVSGVSRDLIENRTAVLNSGGIPNFPWYKSNKGGGAITSGNGLTFFIKYTPNFFEDDPAKYDGRAYGQDVGAWLRLSSHEVGHIQQNLNHGGTWSYLFEFLSQYATAGNHDGAPYEIQADEGRNTFRAFSAYIDKKAGSGALVDLFNSSLRQGQKVNQINRWWSGFQKAQSEAKGNGANSLLSNFNNLAQGTYHWNGSAWVRQ